MEKDILQSCKELKEMPYSVPEGYFDSIKQEIVRMNNSAPVQTNIWSKMAPFLAMAAMFLFILTVGTLFLKESTQESELTAEDYIVFSDSMISTYYNDEQLASAEVMSEDDIIEYLIYSGISTETIELSNE